ncbi:MAG: hypothetical protein A2Z14_04750 [Chloroflexi bacterium RBG_16_48_8]|nr:MAG: hypothetical protein A2Z14_04750 [Chloroflexi bacterium RBG_16_48_8]
MKTTVAEKVSKTNRVFRLIDRSVFTVLMIFLVIVIFSSSKANIHHDSIDYYAIMQRLTQNSGNPIARNLHFVEQRSPGYPIVSLIPYYLISSLVEPFVQTEEIIASPDLAPVAATSPPPAGEPILFRDIFFKNFYIETQDSWFEWKLIASMLFAGYALLFIGLIFIVKSLALENKSFLGASLAPLVAITSGVLMHNIVNTPAYATLTAFGVSCLFGYFFVKGSLERKFAPQFLSGLFVGLLVLTRLETIVIATVVLVSLVVIREFGFLKNHVLGALVPAIILLLYNLSQFGNPFHLGLLRGDINLISLDLGYIYANLFDPQSGILFWSTLVSLGIIGLFLDDTRHTKILGISSLALIALVLVRVPIMFDCVGEGTRLIGGLPVMCPNDMADALMLVRFDTNRYITVLIPFSVIGLRALITSTSKLLRRFGVWQAGTP